MNEILSIQNLKKVYANGVEALHEVSFAVEAGDFFALLGPNGAGKSTTIGVITALVNKTSGKVLVGGYDIDTQTEQAKRLIGLVPQEFNFNIFETVQNILLQQAGYYGVPRKRARERAEFYLKKLGLWEKRNQPSRFLSGGMKRRLMIARALVHDPQLLILDEPTAGVDVELRRTLWSFLSEINGQGTTVILTTHYLEEAENLCRNIAIIDKGRLIANTNMKDLLRTVQSETFVLYFRDPVYELAKMIPFHTKTIDANTIEVEVNQQETLTELFAQLTKQGLVVTSVKNKVNRLEELFLKLTTMIESEKST
jgi:ABC-2 type transport system ATP-binding protein